MICKSGFVVRYGEYVEIRCAETNKLLASFKVLKDMCKEALDLYVGLRHNVLIPYKIRKIKR